MNYLSDILRHFQNPPIHPAFRIRGQSYSYAYLSQRVAAFQSYVQSLNRPQLPVAIECEDHPDCYALILACLFSGCPFVPVHPRHPQERNQVILDLAQIPELLKASEINISEGLKTVPEIQTGNTSAYILFTSGSTGVPKGVPVSHVALQAFFNACDETGLKHLEGKPCLQSFDLTFDLSIFSYLYPLVHGATVCTVPEDEIKQLAIIRILEEESVHTALLVPSVIQLLQPYFDRIELPELKCLLFCGEALPSEILKSFIKSVPQAEVRNVYGPTEATIFCMQYILPANPQEWEAHQGVISIGSPMPGVTVSVDEESQLLLSGAQLADGYLTNEKKHHQAFLHIGSERWYQTGDLVTLHPSGNYLFAGRKDQQVKIQGYRVEIGEVEFQINKWIAPAQAIVVVSSTIGKGQALTAFINKPDLHFSEVQEELKGLLPGYMIPTQWIGLEQFPLNVNGKIDRKYLATLIPA